MSIREDGQAGGVRQMSIDQAHDGQRIDNFLAGLLKGVPKSLIYRLLRTGQVRINGGRAKPATRLADGDRVRVPPVRTASTGPNRQPSVAMKRRIEESIVHEDRDFLVIDKPSGIASHGGSGIDFGAIELLRAARPGDSLELAHRLDRETSGVLVFARRRAALVGLQAAIRDGHTDKQYLALLCGKPARGKFDVNVPLRKSALQGGERMVRVDDHGKPALTTFQVIESFDSASLAKVTLHTGRTHQIRVHAAYVGLPLAGDEKYGNRETNKQLREYGLQRLFLHAALFAFELGERSYSFSAPLASDLAEVLEKLPRQATGKSAR